MFRKIATALLFLAFACLGAHAADFNGKWSAQFDTPVGTQKYTYEFHVDGAKVTGKAISEHGEVAIQEGKIDGDTITFVEVASHDGMEMRIVYTGKITGDSIHFTRQVGDFATDDLTAQRVK